MRDLLESDGMWDDAATVRAQWRAEAEAWSRAALEHWEHSRGLADVVRDASQRGDVVSFTFASVTWAGVVVAVSVDVARVDTGSALVDVRLATEAPFVLRVRAGERSGWRRAGAPVGFVARLRELDGTEVCIGTSSSALEGTLRVGRGQLRLTDADGTCAYVPTGSVWWVRPLAED